MDWAIGDQKVIRDSSQYSGIGNVVFGFVMKDNAERYFDFRPTHQECLLDLSCRQLIWSKGN